MPIKRNRLIGSVKSELIKKSREAALCAIQLFNNPSITFKAETHIVLMMIAWTYLLHAHYRSKGIDYRYYKIVGQRKKFDRTRQSDYKYWGLEDCINNHDSPLDEHTVRNLKFLIGLRHEIEHTMIPSIDDLISAKLQACCLNYNRYLKELFGEQHGLDSQLSFSIQLTLITEEQATELRKYGNIPKGLKMYIKSFEDDLTDEQISHPNYSYRLIFVSKLANHRNQADKVIEYIKADSPLAEGLNREYAIIKETEKPKYLPGQIVNIIRSEGFRSFSIRHHTVLWQENDGKNPKLGYGTLVAGKTWMWYDKWLIFVKHYCTVNKHLYGELS